ncbi:hypothetical protein HanOQP8_Chr00c023g0717321 [Helianthus annuus]|nr:hypothetical protein HanOQP8_Chr00c023g0717321 [Helianthus annuus]
MRKRNQRRRRSAVSGGAAAAAAMFGRRCLRFRVSVHSSLGSAISVQFVTVCLTSNCFVSAYKLSERDICFNPTIMNF